MSGGGGGGCPILLPSSVPTGGGGEGGGGIIGGMMIVYADAFTVYPATSSTILPISLMIRNQQHPPKGSQRRRRQKGEAVVQHHRYRRTIGGKIVAFQTSSSSSSTDIVNTNNNKSPPQKEKLIDDIINNSDTTTTIHYNWTTQNINIAIPALIGMIADPVLSLVDTIFVGRLGSIPLAALGACTSIFHLAFSTFRATTAATTSLVASALGKAVDDDDEKGKKDAAKEEARYVTETSLRLGIIMGCIVSITLLLGSNFALNAMGIPSHSSSPLHPPAKSYLTTRALAAPAVLLITVAEGAFRGYGDTKIPLLASLIAAIMNVILDPIFMFKPFHKGVMGAAAATAVSQVLGALVYVVFLKRRHMLPTMRTHNKKGVAVEEEEEEDAIAAAATASCTAATTTATSTKLQRQNNSSPYIISSNTTTTKTIITNRKSIIRTILQANVATIFKQGSLLFGWAYATSRATRLGYDHLASHQVALSFWLVFALIMDGAAVSGQVLMARAYAAFVGGQRMRRREMEEEGYGINGALGGDGDRGGDKQEEKLKLTNNATMETTHHLHRNPRHEMISLTNYMIRFAILQGAIASLAILSLSQYIPKIFTTDTQVQTQLLNLMPHLALQPILVSLTLIMESLVLGGNKFTLLACGTAISALISMNELRKACSIVDIWSKGIVTLFGFRLLTAVVGVIDLLGIFDKLKRRMRWQQRRRRRRRSSSSDST